MKIRSIMKLAWPYVLMVLLPIISVTILSTYIINSRTEQLISDQSSAIRVATDRVDQKLSSIVELSYLLEENDDLFQYVINSTNGFDNNLSTCETIENLLSGIAQNEDIAEIYFYDAYSGRIIASHTALSEASMFFRYRYQYLDRTPEEAVEQLRRSTWGYSFSATQQVLANNHPRDVIEYRISIPVDRFGRKPSQLTFSLDTKALFQSYFDLLHENAAFEIRNKDGIIFASGDRYSNLAQMKLSSTLERYKTAEGPVYAMELPMNNNLWNVRFYYSKTDSINSGQQILGSLMPAILIPVLLSICICIYFTYKSHRDISEILTLLRGDTGEIEAPSDRQYASHDLILSYAGQVVENNSAYRTKLREFRMSHKDSVLERLVRNAYRTPEEKQKALASVELEVGEKSCAVLCVQFDDICNDFFTADQITIRKLITQLLETHAGCSLEIIDNLPTEIVCILEVSNDLDSVADEIISVLNVQVTYPYGVDLRIGVGNAVDSINHIHRSYDQAREVIRYGESTGKSIRIFSQMDTLGEMVFYPVQTDDRIRNYMIAGHADEAKNVILNIYNENFRDNSRMLAQEDIALVKYRITNVVTSVAEKQGVSILGDTKKFLAEKSVKKYFVALIDLVDVIVKEIMTKKSNAQNVLAVKIRDYIQEHYMDCGLSIKQIAGSFHFHENYISNLYKEEYGENLSYAIEQLRIDRACQLLSTTDIRISEIAAAVGYSSDSSFRRAFKKITGVSPVDYRSTH